MGWTPDTDPSVCFQWSVFGSGPFPPPGETPLYDCPPYPEGSGYGGVGWSIGGGGPSGSIGSPYGLSSYGSRFFPAPDVAVDGGYGGDPYGLGPYGSLDLTAPRMSSALSLNGWEIEVFFSEPMNPDNPALVDPASYVLTPLIGGPSTVLSVRIEDLGSIGVSIGDYQRGVLSVILTHTGTMLGGTYRINCQGPTDMAGNAILNVPITIYTKGEAPPYVVTPFDGDELLFTFTQAMLPTAEEPLGNLYGIEDVESYGFTSDPLYPVEITPTTVTHPYGGDPAVVHMAVNGMTSLDYTSNISPATALDYDGSVLPSDDPGFNGVEIYPANGTSQVTSGYLWMSKVANEPYGWGFWDTSGRAGLVPATIQVDFTFNAEAAQYDPPLSSFPNPQVGVLTIQNGPAGTGVQVSITLQKTGGVDQIRAQCGTFDVTLAVAWSVGTNTVSLVHNRKGAIYAILFNGLPITSAPEALFDQPSMGDPGVSWYFYDEAFSIAGFTIRSLTYTATKTVFSAAWNFLHNASSLFVGSAELTRDSLLTQRGPLVKGWGDATPATKQDVTVLVNGASVEIESVNPYIGQVTLAVPIPLMPLGDPQADVTVDYQWMNTPIMEMAGLNTLGLVLNKWNRARGHHDPAAHGEQVQAFPAFLKGAPDTARFPMGIVLGPMARPQPQLIGHRYMGFERGYSALLNTPTTLLLNQPPHAGEVEGFERTLEGYAVSYEGTQTPVSSTPVWELLGSDDGQVNINEGTYTVIDLDNGPFDPDDPQVVEYYRLEDLTFPASISVVTRFYVEEENLVPDGVFTGVGFGFHNDAHLYLVGALLVNGLQHIGLLMDARYLSTVAAWEISKTTGTIENSTTLRVISSEVPTDLRDGDRFQILEGTQTGVYTADHVVPQCDGTTTITVSPEFPADPKLFGNTFPEVYFETVWSGSASSYRLTVDSAQQVAQLEVSGVTTATLLTFDGTPCTLEDPANTGLELVIGEGGQFFWGSLSRRGTNQSVWSFSRYAVVPNQMNIRGHALRVLTEMDTVPECDTYEWFITQPFGYSKVDSTDEILLLKSTSASESLDFTFGYERLEPFFTSDANFDLRARFKVESGVLGAGDAQIVLNDGMRGVTLGTLLYVEDQPGTEWRQLVNLPNVSISGILDPTQQGWGVISGSDGSRAVHAQDLVVSQATGEAIRFRNYLDKTGLPFSDQGGRILEARLAVDSWTGDANGNTGIRFHCDVGGDHHLGVRLRGGPNVAVQLIDINDNVVHEYPFDWDDGQFHTYRVVAPLSVASLYIDDTAQSPPKNITDFPGNTGQNTVVFGASTQIAGVPQDLASETRWRSLSYSLRPTDACKRTLGVWKGGDKDHINSWEIPRTDSSNALNSAQYGPVIEEMDWQDFMDLRVLRTPDWGVTVFRPDLPLPPYYKPETPGVPGTGFATYTTEPSAGWINVEYPHLPRVVSTFGECLWGALDPRAVTQQRWDYVRYKLYKPITNDYQAPQHMVLNYYNVITSGEMTRDSTYETVVVTTLDNRRVTLKPTHLYAESIWKVVDGETIYTYENYTLGPDNQTITLGQDSLGNNYEFSGDHVPVTIIFIPGRPVTNTYLEAQPLLDSITLLNEGTPPVPKSQIGKDTWVIETIPGSVGASVGASVGGPLDSKILGFEHDPDTLYEELDFFEIKQGETGLLSTICEGGLFEGESGYLPDEEGEPIYSPTGTGPALGGTGASAGLFQTGQFIGITVGGFVIDLKGSGFWEMVGRPQAELLPSVGGVELPNPALFVSGGNYMGPVVDGTGKIIGSTPLGGRLNSATLYRNAKPGSYR